MTQSHFKFTGKTPLSHLLHQFHHVTSFHELLSFLSSVLGFFFFSFSTNHCCSSYKSRALRVCACPPLKRVFFAFPTHIPKNPAPYTTIGWYFLITTYDWFSFGYSANHKKKERRVFCNTGAGEKPRRWEFLQVIGCLENVIIRPANRH